MIQSGTASASSHAPALPSGTNDELVSYLTLRRVVGILGVSMPIVVAVWGLVLPEPHRLLDTISDYYGFRTRDVFVGVLFTIAWFLFTYRGYDRRDSTAGNLACVFALGVALFPHDGQGIDPAIHYLSAASLFLVLAYFSLFLFTKSGGNPTPRKLVRNRVYRACGLVMLACIVLMGLYGLAGKPAVLSPLKPVFWLESFALWAFGFSWFVKGETLWRDAEPGERPSRAGRAPRPHGLAAP